MKNKIFVATIVAFCALCAYKANASEPTPCEAAAKICEVPVYEPAPCAPVETSLEIPEPCAPVMVPSCGEQTSEEQSVFCRSRKTVRKKMVNKKKRCFLASLKEKCDEFAVARETGFKNKSFSFSFCRETEVQVSN